VAAKIPLIVASQPEITGRNPSKLTPQEGSIVTQLGRSYIRKIKDDYPKFIAANQQLAKIYPYNVKAVDLYSFNTKEDNYPTPTFIDEIHLTDEANQSVADRLYYAISSFPKMQVLPKVPTKPLEINK
jgi:lysophospholipase L1-like esterase